MGHNSGTANYTKPTVNLTDNFFLVSEDWLLKGIFWLPSVCLGLPANLLVIFLGKHAKSLGNFRFAINFISVINTLHCTSRAFVLVYYFFHYFFPIETSVISCTIASNFLDTYIGYFIVFFIPLLAAYRYILVCVKGGEIYLTQRNISIVISVVAVLPIVSIAGRIYVTFDDIQYDNDDMCSFTYSDKGCGYCMYISTYGAYVAYALSCIFSLLLFIYLSRSFKNVGGIAGSRRRLRDESWILVCIVLQTVVPILLTIPAKGKTLLRAVGVARLGSAFGTTLYNYNPLFDAIFTIICVKPYRNAVLRIVHLGAADNGTRGPKTENSPIRVSIGAGIPAARITAWSEHYY